MREHVRLGRLFGVNVGINWTVLAIFALITFGLAAGRFPLLFPDLSTTAYVVAGLAAGIVFFLSLLAHEVSHAIVAQRNGVEVDGITLWLFGGVARLEGEATDPGADLRIAGVGPLVSVLLSALFGAVFLALDAAGAHPLAVDVFVWLAIINLVLAIFNLMPAAPLDGGRILRAFLWRRRGDRTSAAVTAARAGRAFGWFIVALGFIELLVVPGFGGIWLMFIGWFLSTAASAEEQHAKVSSALGDVRVADVMSERPATVPADVPVDRFLDEYVFPSRFSTFPVTDDSGKPTGLVTLRRVKELPPDERSGARVQDLACSLDDVPVVGPDDPLSDLVPRMVGCADGRAIVVDEGRVVGVVSPTDIMRQLERSELQTPRPKEHI